MNFLTHLNTCNPADCFGDLANESLAPRWDKVGGCHWYCRHEGSAWQDRLRGCEVSWLTLYFAPWLDQMKQGLMMCVRFTHPCLMWWGILWYYEQIQNNCLTVLNECRVWLRRELLYAECIFLSLLALSSLQAKMDVVHVPTKKTWVQAKPQFTQGIYFAPLNIFRKSLSSTRSLWDCQQPKLLSGTAGLEPCAACFVDNLQAFLRKAGLTSVQGAFQTDKQNHTPPQGSHRFACIWDKVML